MSEPTHDGPKHEPVTLDTEEKISPGAMLRAAREAQGLHIGVLAVTLKVPVKKLEALEADRFDLLPDTVFTRSLALSVCRTLRIDSTLVMLGLPQLQAPPIKTDESGLNTTFKTPGGMGHSALISQMANPVGIGVLILLTIIVAILFWPIKPNDNGSSSSGSDVRGQMLVGTEVPVVVVSSPGPESQLSTSNERPSSTTSVFSKVAAASAALMQSNGVTGVPVALEPRNLPASVTPVPNIAVLTVSAKGESWVEVTDAKGVSQLRKITAAGELLKISGDLPLSVVVGKADMVSIEIRGQPFDLISVSKNNVARFEVK